MNPDSEDNIFRKADAVRLDQQKKEAIHQEVLAFMKKNPIALPVAKKAWFWAWKTPAVVLAGIMVFLLVGGIVSVKADTALPGDLLYPIKIGFNEKVEAALAFSAKAKLNLNIKLAELRLQEAQQLAAENKLTSSNESQISSNFNQHANQALTQLGASGQKNHGQATQAASVDFEASLKAHSVALSDLQKNTKNNSAGTLVTDIAGVISKV